MNRRPSENHATRNRSFDVMRIVFATLVLLSHAPELLDGSRRREPLTMLAHTPLSFGTLAVNGFFLLSGYLMVQSWAADPHPVNFMRKRVLRIVPGYVVATVLSVVVMGLLAPGVPHYFEQIKWTHLAVSLLLLGPPAAPLVTPGHPSQIVNGALWTIAFEFRCYVLIALLGMLTLLRRRVAFLALTLAVCATSTLPGLVDRFSWHGVVAVRVFGATLPLLHFAGIYLIGAGYSICREWIPFRPWMAFVAAALLLAVPRLHPNGFEKAVILLGGYLLFYLCRMRFGWMERLHRLPDISYGVYLYGWPVEALLVFYNFHSPAMIFLCAVAICFALGWLSWHFVERPALKLKRRPAAPLPAG